MNNPGLYNLGDRAITTALTDEVITSGVSAQGVAQELIDRLEGMVSATILAKLTYGSGGTSVAAIVQTSLDSGVSWIDVARFEFTTATAQKTVNLSAAAAVAVAAVSALNSETKVDGVIGPMWRCKLTTVGTYVNTSISVRMVAR